MSSGLIRGGLINKAATASMNVSTAITEACEITPETTPLTHSLTTVTCALALPSSLNMRSPVVDIILGREAAGTGMKIYI